MASPRLSPDTCALCPRLCRHACPVASGSGREAAVPSVIAEVVRGWRQGRVADELAREAVTLCVDCGACQDACHVDAPLPEVLREARRALVRPPRLGAVERVEGRGTRVAVLTDARDWSEALSARLGEPVARLRTDDALGAAAIGHPAWAEHARSLRDVLRGRAPVVAHGGVARALEAAGVTFTWLGDCTDLGALRGGCVARPAEDALGGRPALACCGGAPPLVDHHPTDARRVGARFLRDGGPAGRVGRVRLADVRCADHLRGAGHDVTDVVDVLLGRV